MIGDAPAIKYARRDLVTLDRAVALAPGRRSVVQAGGSLGVFALALSEKFEAVYCFEPHPETFWKFMQNVHCDNVHPFQAALGVDHVRVSTSKSRQRKTHLLPHDGVTHVEPGVPGKIATLRVDDFGLDDLDVLVLDTEGHEFYALRGAEWTVERCKPLVMVEINENCEFYGIHGDDVRTWLRIRGYEFQFREHSDEVWTCRR